MLSALLITYSTFIAIIAHICSVPCLLLIQLSQGICAKYLAYNLYNYYRAFMLVVFLIIYTTIIAEFRSARFLLFI